MTPGILNLDGTRLTCDAGGWRCDDHALQEAIAQAFPFPATAAGTPWVMAFHKAARLLRAKVVQVPEADPLPVLRTAVEARQERLAEDERRDKLGHRYCLDPQGHRIPCGDEGATGGDQGGGDQGGEKGAEKQPATHADKTPADVADTLQDPEKKRAWWQRWIDTAQNAGKAVKEAAGKLFSGLYDRMPHPVQMVLDAVGGLVSGLHNVLEAGKEAAQRMAVQAAQERGLSDEHVETVGNTTRYVDAQLAWFANVFAAHDILEAQQRRQQQRRMVQEHAAEVTGPMAFLAAKIGFFVPVGSLAYLLYSAVRNPGATMLAAVKVVRGEDKEAQAQQKQAHGTHEAVELPLCGKELMGDLLERLEGKDEETADWYLALFGAALSRSFDSRKALVEADASFKRQPAPVGLDDISPEDVTAWLTDYDPPAPWQGEEVAS